MRDEARPPRAGFLGYNLSMLGLLLALLTLTPHSFGWNDTDFLLDGQPFVIRAGEVHFSRIPREYWQHRLRMVRAIGCNTVCAYLFWNVHEPEPGKFDFRGQADAAAFCRMAQQEGLKVILRPGPYSCAEWDGGGFPYWLLKNPDIKLRTRDPVYLAAVKRYLLAVGRQLAPLEWSRGGPILMVQVENEYGSYGSDREYIGVLRDYLKEAGFAGPFVTCDGPSQLKNDTRDDIFCMVNFGSDPEGAFRALREVRPKGPLLCGEYYPGWFDHWGGRHARGDTERILRDLEYMLAHRASFSIYMVHGGTSFGFTAGANSPPYRPIVGSYDYDAPITENGDPTPKFHAIRELMARYLLPGESLPPIPDPIPVISTPSVRLTPVTPLLASLSKPRKSETPLTMEACDQASGLILYRTKLPPGPAARLTVREPHDYAIVMLDGRRLGTLDRRLSQNSLDIPERVATSTLDILVEAMGRVTYGQDLHDRKGITDSVSVTTAEGETTLKGFEIYSLRLDANWLSNLRPRGPGGGPLVYRGALQVDDVGDTFLDMRAWNKGLVWVNGHNLGRYWRIGPQQTMYVPGAWLHKGKNDVVVLDLGETVDDPVVRGLQRPILDHQRSEVRASRQADQLLQLEGVPTVGEEAFEVGRLPTDLCFHAAVGCYVCFESPSACDAHPFANCAELLVLDGKEALLPRTSWKALYADSEELFAMPGRAAFALDGDSSTIWHNQFALPPPSRPMATPGGPVRGGRTEWHPL